MEEQVIKKACDCFYQRAETAAFTITATVTGTKEVELGSCRTMLSSLEDCVTDTGGDIDKVAKSFQ